MTRIIFLRSKQFPVRTLLKLYDIVLANVPRLLSFLSQSEYPLYDYSLFQQ